MKAALFTIFPFLVLYAAFTDTFTMKITNRTTLLLTGGFFLMALFISMPLPEIGMHIVGALLVLSIGMVFNACGWVGGGDVKLIAAIALWLGWDMLYDYTMMSAVFGGVVTFGIIFLRMSVYNIPQLLTSPISKIIDKDSGVPYGIALSGAGLLLYQQSFWFEKLTAIAL
jgi:prepilin peptidase CpaA